MGTNRMKPKNFGAQLIQYYLKSRHSHSILFSRTFTQSNMPGEIIKMQVCKLSEHAMIPTAPMTMSFRLKERSLPRLTFLFVYLMELMDELLPAQDYQPSTVSTLEQE